MEGKRKAAGANEAGPTGNDDRAAKRRKMPRSTQQLQHQSPEDYNLLEGESPQSTTAYGLAFLEQIRKSTDKSGRPIASSFETLIPRKENAAYYERIRLPISLEIIEQKLNSYEFSTLSELEAYFKRMVINAKEFFSRESEEYEDAERIGKTLGTYMAKTNPAYKHTKGYSCPPTPLPDGPEADAGSSPDVAVGEERGDTEEQDSDTGPGRRRTSRRSQRSSIPNTQKPPKPAKPDHEYEGVPYKGLNFQQAQEKIVEELIREEDEEDPANLKKFEPFFSLPSRSLKEYFNIITDPLSLRALQKLVKGIHGRQPATGVSDFKAWTAFEEKASLLWNNAHYFNEEGSPIYDLATELKDMFEEQLKEAKAAVPDPPQPKIKLKVPSAQESPAPSVPGSKKITIHVGGSRGSNAPSPAPFTSRDSTQETAQAGSGAGAAARGSSVPGGPSNGTALADGAKSVSAAVASPSPSLAGLKQETSNHQSPAVVPNGGSSAHPIAVPNGVPVPPASGQLAPRAPVPPPAAQPAAPPPKEMWDSTRRAPGKGAADALITNLLVRTHPSIHVDKRFTIEVPADPKLAQQTVTAIIPSGQYRVQIMPRLPAFEAQQRHYSLFVLVNGRLLSRATPLPIPGDTLQLTANSLVFESALFLGVNWIEAHVVAAIPKEQRTPGGPTCELEKTTVLAHLLR